MLGLLKILHMNFLSWNVLQNSKTSRERKSRGRLKSKLINVNFPISDWFLLMEQGGKIDGYEKFLDKTMCLADEAVEVAFIPQHEVQRSSSCTNFFIK